jgi:hypothetical protein
MAASFAVNASTSAAALYNRGNELYKDGKFGEAREAYKQALATGVANAALYFNLGNAELRSGRLGPAIADYLRAQRLRPRDPDISFNLEYARQRIAALPEDLPRGPFTKAFNYVTGALSANEWTMVALGAYWMMCAAWIALIVSGGRSGRQASRMLVYAALVILVMALPFAGTRIKRDHLTPRGVMVVEKITARSGPGNENAALFELYEGVDVVVGQCERGWCRVSAQGGFMGWVKADSFERL